MSALDHEIDAHMNAAAERLVADMLARRVARIDRAQRSIPVATRMEAARDIAKIHDELDDLRGGLDAELTRRDRGALDFGLALDLATEIAVKQRGLG